LRFRVAPLATAGMTLGGGLQYPN